MKKSVKETRPLKDSAVVAEVIRSILKTESTIDQDKEHVWVIGLTQRNTIKYLELVYLGTLTGSPVHPREIFRYAISQGVASIIMVHNHPSGGIVPSQADIQITKQLKEAGKIIGIQLMDHIIVAGELHHSLYEKGVI